MLNDTITKIRNDLNDNKYSNEASISTGIVLNILQKLNWDIFNTELIKPEYIVNKNKRVDYALFKQSITDTIPYIFIEVKNIGKINGADRQLFEYAFHGGVPIIISTDGVCWNFYLTMEPGDYEKRKFFHINLLKDDLISSEDAFIKYLDYNNIISGNSLESAKLDYYNNIKRKEIECAIPKSFKNILFYNNIEFLKLLKDNVKKVCGYEPNDKICNNFLEKIKNNINIKNNDDKENINNKNIITKKKYKKKKKEKCIFKLSFKDDTYEFDYFSHMLEKFFKLVSEEDIKYINKFYNKYYKSNSRNYISINRYDLYPGRSDLCDTCSKEFIPGWWLGTNYSINSMIKIYELLKNELPLDLQSNIKFESIKI